jgi:hypothetical protein
VKSLHVRSFQIEGHDIPIALLCGEQVDLACVLLTLYSGIGLEFFSVDEISNLDKDYTLPLCIFS